MKRTSTIFTILAALTMIAATFPGGQSQLTINDQSRMWVDGTSTIHDWMCEVGTVEGSIMLDAEVGQVSNAVVTVPSASIDCDNSTMNKKASKALSVGDYPTIRFTLDEADVARDGKDLRIEALGKLEMAGATKAVEASLVGQPAADGGFRFMGSMPIVMSDFGVDAPTAMLGTIRTGDEVTVRFELVTDAGFPSMTSAK